MAVSKVFCADHELVNIMIEEAVDFIADSRIENLKDITPSVPKVLLRLPMFSEAHDVVKYSDISLNSEFETIEELNHQAYHLGKTHGVIIMIDLGDLREGIFEELEVYAVIEEVLKLEYIELKGIGVNLTCYGGIIPTPEILQKLVDYKTEIESRFDLYLEIVSGGNSSNIELMMKGKIPIGINNIRLGEAIVLGRETAYGSGIEGLYDDVFTLEAEVIEVKKKPSMPIGTIGMNAFGKTPEFEDKGERIRAIIGIGKQDVDHNELMPYDTIKAIGSSSDHIILDVSDGYNNYSIGDQVLFKLTYGSVLSLFTSPYVKRLYLDESL
jgi:predicted amino acid racemase